MVQADTKLKETEAEKKAGADTQLIGANIDAIKQQINNAKAQEALTKVQTEIAQLDKTFKDQTLPESNPVVRVVASSTTFWLFTDLSRSERLFTFSSHSMSFRALVDVGFWDKTIVTEDSRIFLQGLVRYDA